MKKTILCLFAMLLIISANAQTSAKISVLPSQLGNSGKYLKTNGSSVSWANVTAGLTGTGTFNYIPKFSSASTLINSAIYESTVGIGINNTTPFCTLDVNGNSKFTGSIGQNLNPNDIISYFLQPNGTQYYGFACQGSYGVSNFAAFYGTNRTQYYAVNGGASGFEVDFTNPISYLRTGLIIGNTATNSSDNVGIYLDVRNGSNNYSIKSVNGKVNLSNLPTSTTGLVTGDLWNDTGTLKIIP